MGTVAVHLSGARKAYGRGTHARTVFDRLDLDVHAGELLAVVGPSGTGKSTLLRAIAGLEPLDAGRVEFHSGPSSPAIGVVFQEPLLAPWLTVRQNVGLGGRFRANRTRFEDVEVTRLLDRFGLAELAERSPNELSGGQAQRVAVARAAAIRPDLLLLDEPFSALDVATRHRLQEWLRAAVDALDVTAVLVTHDIDEAVFLGHRIALLGGSPHSPAGLEIVTNDRPVSREDVADHPVRAAVLERYATAPAAVAKGTR